MLSSISSAEASVSTPRLKRGGDGLGLHESQLYSLDMECLLPVENQDGSGLITLSLTKGFE